MLTPGALINGPDEKDCESLSEGYYLKRYICNTTVSEAPGPDFSKVLDVIMLAVTGGQERTPSEYEALLSRAGFRLERIITTPSQYSIIEAVVI